MVKELNKLNYINNIINIFIFATLVIIGITIMLGIIELINNKIMLIIGAFGLTVLIIAGCAGIITDTKIEHTRDISKYTIYLDGNEVDMDKIDIKLYKRSYDDENLKIFLTHRK